MVISADVAPAANETDVGNVKRLFSSVHEMFTVSADLSSTRMMVTLNDDSSAPTVMVAGFVSGKYAPGDWAPGVYFFVVGASGEYGSQRQSRV